MNRFAWLPIIFVVIASSLADNVTTEITTEKVAQVTKAAITKSGICQSCECKGKLNWKMLENVSII